ncbi:ornithine carbamoyltransferase [Campylobacter sp. faydin G-24]|uniref:Ornithine carbamoyltransferase n=1 Tax=Campylobacter anatolicus TaxID=2829105 RepID=A0ABS5HIK2_9BACT|nr:ornithine carbamoyltransferase [Campylobacter anatolicus]MBR8464088.1 ornithine carbamoyltransferase [Campylobacter anatolicus]
MKISCECECILLQNSLMLFLKDYISHYKDCDFVITDKRLNIQKPQFIIADNAAHLSVPFSKNALFNMLEEFYSAIQLKQVLHKEIQNVDIEAQVGALVDKFKADLIALLRAKFE